MADIVSRPYQPAGEKCCEACVFGRGPHAYWCDQHPMNRLKDILAQGGRVAYTDGRGNYSSYPTLTCHVPVSL